ncbi:hypothetical protein Trydic_g20473 [Trypoxylus dichotomus]
METDSAPETYPTATTRSFRGSFRPEFASYCLGSIRFPRVVANVIVRLLDVAYRSLLVLKPLNCYFVVVNCSSEEMKAPTRLDNNGAHRDDGWLDG